jgi:hypothetical protein
VTEEYNIIKNIYRGNDTGLGVRVGATPVGE